MILSTNYSITDSLPTVPAPVPGGFTDPTSSSTVTPTNMGGETCGRGPPSPAVVGGVVGASVLAVVVLVAVLVIAVMVVLRIRTRRRKRKWDGPKVTPVKMKVMTGPTHSG